MATSERQELQSTPTPESEDPTTQNDGDRTDTINKQSEKADLTKMKSQEMLDSMVIEDDYLKELRFAKFIVKCPCLLCVIILAILLMIAVIDGALFDGMSDDDGRTYFPNPPDEYVDALDGYTLASELVSFEENDTNSITQSEEYGPFMYQMFFTLSDYKNDFDENNPSNTDYWILTPENIKTILKWEDKIAESQEWKNRFCWVGEDPMETNYSCQVNTAEAAIISPARYIQDYFEERGRGDSYTTDDVKNVTMNDLIFGTELNLRFCFNPGVAETGQTYIYRSFFKSGTPIGNGQLEYVNGTRIHLSDYKNAEDDLNEGDTSQNDEFLDWALIIYDEMLIDENGELSDGGLGILVMNGACIGSYFNSLIGESFFFFYLAVFIVLIYMSFHLQSIFLSCGAMLQILMSFPLAYFVYRVLFGIEYFGFLNILIIFVLLGVGADDVFVFTDAWLQSVHFVDSVERLTGDDAKNCCGFDKSEEPKNILRMSFTFRRAAKAMLVTQITTFFAFIATSISNLVPMSAFGLWAASIVAMNYLLVITLYPAILIIHHKYIKSWEIKILCFCCNLCNKAKQSRGNNNNQETIGAEETDPDAPPKMPRQITRQMSVEEQSEEYRKIERFLGVKYARFVIKYKYFFLVFFLILLILSITGFAHMKTATSIDAALADDHPIEIASAKLAEFSASETDGLIQSWLTFGIAGVNRDDAKKYKPNEDYGTIIWDNNFKFSSSEQQLYLKFICNSFKNQSIDNGRGDLVYSADLVYCPIADFETYLTANNEDFPYIYTGTDMTQDEAFIDKWDEFLATSYGYTSLQYALSYVDIDAEKIRYYAMYYKTSISWNTDGGEVEEYLDDLNAFIASLTDSSSDCPDNLCGSIMNAGFRWVVVSMTNAFISSAIQGIVLAMPLAFIVMIISTQNWIIALYAALDIIGVMLTELAFMYINGWDFGLYESIAVIIIIGFSVDYVVHLANAYLESGSESRDERVAFALLTMGISVVSGALTTFLAGFFLIFPSLTFFVKMGIIMMSTVIVSIIWALCFFTAICAAIGPQGHQGDIKTYFRMCCKKGKGGSNNDDNETGDIEMR